MFPCICPVIDHRGRQNGVRTSVTHSAIASCATFLFLPHFDVICDLLLDRCTATWNLFVKSLMFLVSNVDNIMICHWFYKGLIFWYSALGFYQMSIIYLDIIRILLKFEFLLYYDVVINHDIARIIIKWNTNVFFSLWYSAIWYNAMLSFYNK